MFNHFVKRNELFNILCVGGEFVRISMAQLYMFIFLLSVTAICLISHLVKWLTILI